MKLAIALAVTAACVHHGSPATGDDGGGSDGGGSNGGGSDANASDSCTPPEAEPDLCTSVPDVRSAFDVWAATQPTNDSIGYFHYRLDAVIEPGPEPVFAVTMDEPYGNQYVEEKYVIALDVHGAEIGRAPGRYLDRIGPGKFLLDRAYARLTYIPFHDPLYYSGLQVYAADRTGTQLWRVATTCAAARSTVYRADTGHWLIVGLFNGSHDPELTYFNADGQVTPQVAGDPRSCVVQPP